MEPAGLLSLPVEMLSHIGRFLAVEDILACSATCHYLRDAFNNNTIWKKYLPETLDLHNEEFCSEPTFSSEETLTPLCKNRVISMNKIKLLNNWENAKFVKTSTKTSCSNGSWVMNASKVVGQAIYQNRYLFFGRVKNDIDIESDAVEVWDIIEKPVLLIELKMDRLSYKTIYIVGDCLVVVECALVKVYEIRVSEKALPLLFSILVTENDVVFGEHLAHSCDLGCFGFHYSVIDHYLFADQIVDESESCVFHVWDIVNACKVGSFLPFISGFVIKYHSHMGNKWFLRMIKQSDRDSYFFQFDIQTKEFSEHVFVTDKLLCHSLVFDKYFILFELADCNEEGWFDTICSVYDFNSSKKCQERRFNDGRMNHQITSTKVINGQFVMFCVDGFHVFDALTLDTIQKFPESSFGDVCFITHQLNIHGSVFVLAANSNDLLDIWNVRKKEKIAKGLNEVYMSNLYLNASFTKLVCVKHNEITVYHFH